MGSPELQSEDVTGKYCFFACRPKAKLQITGAAVFSCISLCSRLTADGNAVTTR